MNRANTLARIVAIAALSLLSGCARDIDPVGGVAEARVLLEQGRSSEARILLKNLLAQHPATPSARVLLARIALEDGNAKAANDEISVLDDTALTDPEALRVRVRVDIETGKPDAALKRIEGSGEKIPQPDRALLMAEAYRALDSLAEALALLREVEKVSDASEPLVLGIAGTLAAMGNMEAATSELDRYLATSPLDRADALRLRGDVKLRQGKPAEAATDYHAALAAAAATWPRITRITTELMIADAQVAAGEIDAAKLQLAKVEKAWAGTLGAMVLQGQIALLEGRFDEAVNRLGAVVEAGAGNGRVEYLLVEALMKAGNSASASQLLEELAAEEPESSPTRRVLAAKFLELGRPDRVIDILGADAELGVSDGVNANDDLLAAARLARDDAARAISTLKGKLATTPSDPKLRAQLATAQLANGEPAVALGTLGRFVEGRQDALGISTRLSALYLTGNEIEANRVLDRLLSTEAGSDLAVLLAAADAASQRQQGAAVSRLLDRALILAPADPEVLMRRADLAFTDRKYDEATGTLNELLRSKPGDARAQLALARVAEARGDVAASRKALQIAVSEHPAAIEPALMLASLELRASQVETASNVMGQLIQNNMDANAPNAAGLLFAGAGRYEEARTRFRQAIDREMNNAGYWYNLGEAQLALKDSPAALQSFLRSAGLQPDSLRAGFAAVRLGVEQKDIVSARRVAQTLVTRLPKSSTSWLLLGEVQAASDDTAGAEASFARSYAARPNSLSAMREFAARVASGTQRPEEPLLKWLAREPTDTVARLMLVDFNLLRGRDEVAREHLEIIVRQSPNDLAALNNLAWVLRSSAPERAETLARRAFAIAPDNAAVADTLGVILLASDKTDEAVAVLSQAAAAMPGDRSIQYHYARSLTRVGQKDKARGILARVLKDQGGFPDRAAAQRLFEELG